MTKPATHLYIGVLSPTIRAFDEHVSLYHPESSPAGGIRYSGRVAFVPLTPYTTAASVRGLELASVARLRNWHAPPRAEDGAKMRGLDQFARQALRP